MLETIFLLIAMAFLMLAIALVVYEVVFKGLRNIREMKFEQPSICLGLYILFFAVFLVL